MLDPRITAYERDMRRDPVGHGCHVLPLPDGRYRVVGSSEDFVSKECVDGEFSGNIDFVVDRSSSRSVVVPKRIKDVGATSNLIGVTSRDITYFYLQEERLNGAFNCGYGGALLPTVGGTYPSSINLADYPPGVFTSVDPSTVLTDATYGWTVPDPTLDPYYLTNGASLWVQGDTSVGTSPGSPGFVDLPLRENTVIGSMRTLSLTIGADDYEWDVYAVTVREYRYEIYTWAEWWAL